MEPPSQVSRTCCSALTLCKPPAESLGVDVVDEGAPPVDLDHGQQLAVARLQVRDAADVHLLELERELRAQPLQNRPRALAQAAARRAVERDARGAAQG